MSKYSFKFKLKVVNDYLSGKGGDRFLSNKYGISGFKQVQKWVTAYKALGATGLQRKRQNTALMTRWVLIIDKREACLNQSPRNLKKNAQSLNNSWQKLRKNCFICVLRTSI